MQLDLVDKIMNTQEAVASKTTQVKDASSLREFSQFCEGHGIKSSNAFPANEELLVAWAASYAGRLAGKTVSIKLRAVRREHERRGLVWQGGALLRRILKGVEELRPVSSFNSKRAPSISMLGNLNRGLTAVGDIKPAAPQKKVDRESNDSFQSDDGDDDKAESVIIVEDSDSDGDVQMVDVVSTVNDSNKRKATDDAQPQAKKAKVDGDALEESKTIFVKRLSWSVGNDRLAQAFAHCGEVESANVLVDRDSGNSRGFGYVRFKTSDAVEKALLMNGQEIDGRAVNIDRYNVDRAQANQTSPPCSTLFICNLGSDVLEDTVRSFFDDYRVKSVRLPIDHDTGRHKGFGFVGFEDVDGAKKAFEATNGADIEGRSIRLDYYRPRDSSGGSRGGGFDRGGRVGRGFGDRGGHGGSRGFGGRDGFGGRGGFGDHCVRGNDRGRGRGVPRGMSQNGGIATFDGKKIVFEFTFEDKKIT